MRSIPVLLLLLLILSSAAPPVTVGPLLRCDGGACAPIDLSDLSLDGEAVLLARSVEVAPEAGPVDRPLMVRIVAMASAEVRWNGELVGFNGRPGPDAAAEEPGRFVASFLIPSRLLRPGANRLEVRLSAHHLWLPVRNPVHGLWVAPYEGEELPGLIDYIPALLALGALVAGGIYFATFYAGTKERDALLLALAALAGILQLAAEVSRAFIAYTYPWHLARVSLIALMAAAASLLLALYAARRFAPDRERGVAGAMAGALAVSLLLVPWFDVKAMSVILAGALAAGACAVTGMRQERPGARAALTAAAAAILLLGWEFTFFLDRGWFLLLGALFVVLVAEQVHDIRRARSERDAEAARAAALAERLARAERAGEPILALKDGSRTHRVAEADLLFLRAADDYCDAVLADGRTLLVTMTLARLLGQLPDRFVRVHKSYAVNRALVLGSAPRSGGGRMLRLSDGSEIPVGRSYAAAAMMFS